MEHNGKNNKENRSMYFYTALIFVVAILLIILAFFGQSNISRLGNRANEIADSTEIASLAPTNAPPSTDEFARISNMASALDKENKELKDKLSVYDNLINEIDSIVNNLVQYKKAMENNDREKLEELLRDGKILKEKIDG